MPRAPVRSGLARRRQKDATYPGGREGEARDNGRELEPPELSSIV